MSVLPSSSYPVSSPLICIRIWSASAIPCNSSILAFNCSVQSFKSAKMVKLLKHVDLIISWQEPEAWSVSLFGLRKRSSVQPTSMSSFSSSKGISSLSWFHLWISPMSDAYGLGSRPCKSLSLTLATVSRKSASTSSLVFPPLEMSLTKKKNWSQVRSGSNTTICTRLLLISSTVPLSKSREPQSPSSISLICSTGIW